MKITQYVQGEVNSKRIQDAGMRDTRGAICRTTGGISIERRRRGSEKPLRKVLNR